MATGDKLVNLDSLKTAYDTVAKITAPMEASGTASAAHAAGEHFIYNGTLYIATTDIESGATIIPNTNCQAVPGGIGGKVSELKSTFDGEMYGTNGIIDYIKPSKYIIDSSGVWNTSTGRHIAVKVAPGDVISFTANSNYDGIYAALKSDNAVKNVAADFCANTGSETWQERKVVTKDESVTFTAPSDCNYIYIAVHGNNSSAISTPASLKVNGIEYQYNIRKKIDEHTQSIATIQGDIASVNTEMEDIEGEQVTIETKLISRANKRNLGVWGMRSEFGRMFAPIDFSGISFLSGFDLPVFTDGYKIVHGVDLSKYKNNSANTVTVSTNVELAAAISAAASGDTIILNDGVYEPIVLTKSVNLIGNGKPVFVTDDAGTFDETGSPVVFRTASTFTDAITDVYDASRIDEGIIVPLKQKASVSGVTNNPGSWVLSSSGNIYVHLFDGRVATNRNVIICDKTKIPIKCIEPTENATIYMENITVVGGDSNLLYNDYGSYNTQKLIAKGCRFYFGRTYNNVSLLGVDGFFQNCEASFSHKDGFNYHKNVNSEYPGGSGPNTGTVANGFEIDCIGHDNGYDDTASTPSDNGSTMHNGGTAVRINGIYYHNKGGNVADIGSNTKSYNYCCYAFDNMAPQDTNNADFWVNSSATMYLYGCRADGDSQYNLWVQNSATLYADKTEYTTHLGDIS